MQNKVIVRRGVSYYSRNNYTVELLTNIYLSKDNELP